MTIPTMSFDNIRDLINVQYPNHRKKNGGISNIFAGGVSQSPASIFNKILNNIKGDNYDRDIDNDNDNTVISRENYIYKNSNEELFK